MGNNNSIFCARHVDQLALMDDDMMSTVQTAASLTSAIVNTRDVENEVWMSWSRIVRASEAAKLSVINAQLAANGRRPPKSPAERDLDACKKDTHWNRQGIVIRTLAIRIKKQLNLSVSSVSSTTTQVVEAEESTPCPVCYLNMYRDGMANLVLGCGHMLCFPCALQMRDDTCIICRAKVKFGLAAYQA